ncbi:MtrB/PioB family decaheme-associated outer membrane protein [Wenzhouxiangella sediminis]|uniref:MtrB/PioB family decaheme-associated outer membrane protein n=1 Tax=Wenzhouxiangella sediminis TaxID=1792836 RepID=A0A3E1KC35_9GAMM|nr:MtrB/PioB family decaheme-associated outer membrane protein [Wenzhouxiangella sediminis]RFF32292.1 MtrB/PioB family decaheme-associated outer membrane protein [Wenzhouxiangella sediminis]
MRTPLAAVFVIATALVAMTAPSRAAGMQLFGSIDLGLAWLDEDAERFGRFSGLDEAGMSPLVDIRLERPRQGSDDWYLRLEGSRLGLPSRRLDFLAERSGRQALSLSWREMPGWSLSGGATPFMAGPGGRLSLPGNWQGLETTAGLAASDAELHPVEIRSRRKRLDLGYWQRFRDRWRVEVEASEERRDGNRLIGAIFGYTGGNPRGMLLPAVVDDSTRRLESRLTYADPAGHQYGVAWSGSFYRNDRRSIEFDNAFARHPQWPPAAGYPEGVGRIADYPDNSAHQLRAFGTWTLGDRTRLGADLAYGLMRQDDLLLPYTANEQLQVDEPLPVTRLDAEMRTTVANLRLVTQASDRLNLVVAYRYDDRDNRTPSLPWRIVSADSQGQRAVEDTRINLPYSLRRQKLEIDGRWRLDGYQRLVGGVAFEREDRDDFAEVAQLDEWGGEIGWRGRVGSKMRLRLDAERSTRRFDEYVGRAPFRAGRLPGTVEPEDFENHPELRKYNVADRDRTGIGLRLDAQPTARLNLGLGGRYHRDDYDDERFGLERSEVRTVSADFGWQLSRAVTVSGLYASDRYRADQSGRDWPGFAPQLAFDPARNWWASHDDRVETASVSLAWRDADFARRLMASLGLNGGVDLGADFVYVSARGDIDVRAAEGLNVEPLPETLSRRRSWAAWASYSAPSGWRVQLRVEHERFRSRDYAFEDVAIDSVANLLLLGRAAPDYSVTAVLATLGYRF